MRSVSAVSLFALLVPGFAMAQEATAPAAAAPAAAAPEMKTELFGNVTGSVYLLDSQRSDTPEVTIDDLNLGVNATKGLGKGTFKLNISHAGAVTVKEANAGLDLPFGLGVSLGRHNTGIYNWESAVADDSWMDSLKLRYNLGLGEKQNVAFNVYYGNTFSGSINYDRSPQTQWRAYGFVAEANFGEIFGSLRYGTEGNRLVGEATATPTGATAPVTTYAVAPWSTLKLEAGYDMGKLGGKVYYGMQNIGKVKAVAAEKEANKYKTTGDAQGEETKLSAFGAEAWGDSNVWGMSGILAPEDKLTYGLVFENNVVDAASKVSDNKIVLKGGYKVQTVGAWLEFETHSADKEIYVESKDSKATKSKSQLTFNINCDF